VSLQVEDLSVSYGNIRALWGVSVKVEKGEIVSLIGANGAGKSTLLKSIMGLVKSQGGKVSFEGKNLANSRTNSIVKMGVGYVPEGRRLFPRLSVEENLRMGAPRRCLDLSKRFGELFELFPVLKDRKAQNASTLSGGEQQMVAIGRALMGKPKMLLLDELSFGLAPIVFEKVLSAIEAINSSGVSILLAEQNSERALEVSKHSYVLENGRIVLEGESGRLMRDPSVNAAYLGSV
jgi:branched-chain amino acid transport system ATP-binding protein